MEINSPSGSRELLFYRGESYCTSSAQGEQLLRLPSTFTRPGSETQQGLVDLIKLQKWGKDWETGGERDHVMRGTRVQGHEQL